MATVKGQRQGGGASEATPTHFGLDAAGAIEASRAAGDFARGCGFTPALADAAAGAVEEAALQLVRRAPADSPPFSLRAVRERDALLLEVRYARAIAFDPPALARQAAAGRVTDPLEKFDAEVWLRLAKHYVDEVVYVVDGAERVMRLRLYARRAGQERALWFLELRPRLRTDIEIEEQMGPDGAIDGLLHDPVGGEVLPVGERGLFVVRRLDGRTPMRDLYLASIGRFGLASPHEIGALLKRLDGLEFLESGHPGKRRPWQERWLAPSFSLPNAERFMAALHRAVRPLVSPAGAALLLAIGFSGLVPGWAETERLGRLLGAPFHGFQDGVRALPGVVALAALILLVHELGHGVVCRHFGGRVSRFGVEFYLGTPVFYCDVTSSWLFRDKWHRILVSAGGPVTTFAFLGACLWGFHFAAGSHPGLALVFYGGALFSGAALAMNLDPFLRMDAYYALMDWLEIPDLRRRAFRYLGGLLPGNFFPAPESAPEGREKRILIAYGVAGGVVTAMYLALILAHYVRRLVAEEGWSVHAYLFAALLALLLWQGFTAVSRMARRVRHREFAL